MSDQEEVLRIQKKLSKVISGDESVSGKSQFKVFTGTPALFLLY